MDAEKTAQFLSISNSFPKLWYPEKLTFFDTQFGIIPFSFPQWDMEASWFSNEQKMASLVNILESERGRPNLLRREIMADNKSFIFDIRPITKKETIEFNNYVLKKFLSSGRQSLDLFIFDLNRAANKQALLENRISRISTIIGWMNNILHEYPASALRVKFLNIVNNGFLAYQQGVNSSITKRRKFIELFLYSQGFLLAEHYADLLMRLNMHPASITNDKKLGLPLKIALLHELGILEQLQKKIEKTSFQGNYYKLAKVICMITSETTESYQSVVEYLTSLSTGNSKDPLSKNNRKVIEQKLTTLDL